VGRPEEAERPAPRSARTRVDFARWAWKDRRSSGSMEFVVEDEEAIVRSLEVVIVLVVVKKIDRFRKQRGL